MPPDFQLDDAFYSSPYSDLYRLRIPGYDRPWVVKLFKDGAESPKSQFNALCALAERLGPEAGSRVPQPLALLEDVGAVVMEYVAAPSLTRSLGIARTGRKNIFRLLAKVGREVAHFHMTDGGAPAVYDSAANLRRFEEVMARGDAPAWHGPAIALMAGLREICETLPVPHGLVYGDLKPDNILIEGDRIVWIDFHADSRNVVTVDIAQFLNHLFFHVHSPQAFHLVPFYGRLQNAFLSGYRGEIGDLPSMHLSWMRLFNLVNLSNRFVVGSGGTMRDRVRRAVFGLLARRLIAELSRSRERL